MPTLSELHKNVLTQVLRRLLVLRRNVEGWDFVSSTDASENLKLIFQAEAHHLVGKTLSRVSLLPSPLYQAHASTDAISGKSNGDAKAHLEAVQDDNAKVVNTTWYKIPACAYGHISVGAFLSGHEDASNYHALNKSRRIARYMRDDSRGDFLTLTRNARRVELFYNFPRGTCHRVRAFVRFDATRFDLCMRSAGLGGALEEMLCGLLGAITMSHVIQEQRQCPYCHNAPAGCFCEFRALPTGAGAEGLRNNALNVFEQIGEYYGRSFHFVRSQGYLQEHFNKNVIFATDRVKGESLRQWAVQHCCSTMPLVPSPMQRLELLTPPGVCSTNTSALVSPLMLPDAVSRDVELGIQAQGQGQVQAQAPACIGLRNTASTIVMAGGVEPALSDISFDGGKGVQLGGVVQTVSVMKPPPKRRGRKPRAPVIRPVHPVRIAPVPGGAVRSPPSEFQSVEEFKKYQKKLRSRMSAQKSNQKRSEKNKEEKRRRAAAEREPGTS